MTSHHAVSSLTLLLLVAACTEPDAGLAPRRSASEPLSALSDAANGGRAGFYFRSPVGRSLGGYPGTFDPNLLPVLSVKVCPINLSGTCTGSDVVFDQASTPAVTRDLTAESYGVRWSPPAAGDYRTRVYSGTTLLGFADIRVFAPGGGRRVVPVGYTDMVLPASLNLRFRIETGIVVAVAVTPSTGVAVVNATTVAFTATATDLYGAAIPTATFSWSSSPTSIGTVSSSGVATGVAEGDAIITASSGGVSGTANLTVIGDLNTVLGVSTKLVPRSDACGATDGRHCESIVGDVITDAMRFTYSVDFAITNSGGIRADLTCPTSDDVVDFCPAYVPPPFPITRGQVLSVLPFGNRAVTLSLNGAELKVMLEIGVSQMPLRDGRFPQVSGLCFTYDISLPVGSRVIAAVRQASDGSCTGAAINLTSSGAYTLAENDFMAAGGDTYPDFSARATVRTLLDRITSAYVASSSPISPATQGRIVCTTSGATACPVVTPQ